MKHSLKTLAKNPSIVMAAVVMTLSLTACQRSQENPTVGQQVDSAVEQTRSAAERAKQEAGTAATDIKNDAKAMVNEASDKVADAAITASVNTDLAKDSELSALKINVDTNNGHVTLHGTAPSEEAKQRATKLAGTIKGVTSVDNELTIQK